MNKIKFINTKTGETKTIKVTQSIKELHKRTHTNFTMRTACLFMAPQGFVRAGLRG